MRFKKGKLVIEKRDLWDLDYTLSQVIYASLVAFKQTNYVIPQQFIKSLNAANGKHTGALITHTYTKEEDDYFATEYGKVLDKMIYAFRPQEDYTDLPVFQVYNFDANWFKDGKFEAVLKDGVTAEQYSKYVKDSQQWEKDDFELRLEGRLLFATYFTGLWS